MSAYILIKNLYVQNANAFSSAITVGFPAMTAWLGFAHALQRKINENDKFKNVKLSKTAIACNEFKVHLHKGIDDYHASVIGTANPLTKEGKRSSFIEEARCNIDASLLIECEGLNSFELDNFKLLVENLLISKLKFAGGDILCFSKIDYIVAEEDYEKRKLLNSLMPGYIIIERRELLQDAMENGKDALDALIDTISVKTYCTKTDDDEPLWQTKRIYQGWLVPIAVGFQGISELTPPGKTLCQRDNVTPHRFAEPIVTLGEFKLPARIKNFESAFWQYQYLEDKNLYLCINKGE